VEGNSGGTITSAGLYTAPNTAGTYHVLVTSQADTTKSATAVVTVSASPTRTVTGSTVVTFHTTDTTGAFTPPQDVPQNASTFALAALVPNGNGGFTSISGTGASDGTYSITGVPTGYFWLTDGRGTFVWTQNNTVDTGIDYIGDSTVTIGSATVSLTMTGASAWQTSDFAIFYSPNTGTYKRFFTSGSAGSTSLSDVIDLTSPLLNSTKGDYAIVYQLVHHTVTGGGYKAVERFYSQPDPFSTPNGVQTQLNAAFTPVTNNSTVHLSVNASQFATFTPLMGPGATNSSTCLGVQALPSSAGTGFTNNVAGDVILADDCQSGTPNLADRNLGDIPYGDPYFPPNWPLFAEFVHMVSVPYTLPGTTAAYNATAGNIAYNTTLPTSTAPIVPLVGPVLNPTIKAYGSSTSVSFQSNASGVGTSPVIAWDSPSASFGTPTEYVVTITALANSSGTTVAQTLASKTLWIGGGVHSIQVPPGVMTTGNTYFIEISAVVATGLDAESSPYRRSLPYGQSDVLSGLITP
jgi:hypothetical protein